MGVSVFLAAIALAGQSTTPLTFDEKVQKLADDVKFNLTLFDSLKRRVTNEKEAQKLIVSLSEKMNSIAQTAINYQAQAKSDGQRIKLSVVRFEALASTGKSPTEIESLAGEIATKYREVTAFALTIESMVFASYLTNDRYPPFDATLKQSKNEEVLASAYLANFFMQTLDDAVDINKFRTLGQTYPKTKAGQRAARVYDFRTKLSLGAPMPPLEFDLTGGQKVKTSALLGKVVVIDFWGYWSSACTSEMAEIKDYVKSNPSKLMWIGVNTDSWTKGFLSQRLKEDGIKYPNVYSGSPSGALPMDLGIVDYPSKIIIDSFGIVRYVPSVKDWRRVLDDALSKA